MTDADYTDDLALPANTPTLAWSKYQDTLASTWTQIKLCWYVLDKKELPPF